MDEILKMQVMVGRAQLQYHDHQMLLKLQQVVTIRAHFMLVVAYNVPDNSMFQMILQMLYRLQLVDIIHVLSNLMVRWNVGEKVGIQLL